MQVAKVVENQILAVNDYKKMFPNVSFPKTGPNTSFMERENLVYVQGFKPHNPVTQRLIATEPYLDNGNVYVVTVQDLSPEELQTVEANRIKAMVDMFATEAQTRLDNFAVSGGYTNILSVCTYDTSTVEKYRNDAIRARLLRDQWWSTLDTILAAILSHQRPEPQSFEEIESELPPLTWS